MDELIGKAFGPYTIVEKIGEGGMAVVYKGYQESLNRYVAVKVLRGELARDQQFIARFRREALASGGLNHPNILHVYDAGVAHGVYYIVMDYAQAGSLKDLMVRGPLDPERAMSIAAQVADALDYAHRQGLVHRDVKPTNILLTSEGRPLLGDFGIAKVLYETSKLTRTGTSIGTPDYMAPEQIQGEAVDGRTDLYALGIVLFEMLTGRVPFRATTPAALLYKHVNEPPPPLRSLGIEAPAWLQAVLDRALAKHPQDRFQRGSQFAQALRQQYVPGVAQRPPTRREDGRARRPTPPPSERRRATPPPTAVASGGGGLVWILVAAIAVVFLAVVGVGAALLLGGPRQPEQTKGPGVVTMVVTSQVVTQVVTAAPGGPTATLVAVSTAAPRPTEAATAPPPTNTPPPPTRTPIPPPTAAPAYDISSLKADITDLRFFEGPYTLPDRDERNYTTRFARSEARYINYELNLKFPAPGERRDFQVEAVYYQPDGSELARFTADYHLEADWTTSWHAKGWGWDDPGKWPTGQYWVELYVDGQLIGTGTFEVVG
jgi:tRNA A-37 threonylcarbamoyl transferase component Bud32